MGVVDTRQSRAIGIPSAREVRQRQSSSNPFSNISSGRPDALKKLSGKSSGKSSSKSSTKKDTSSPTGYSDSKGQPVSSAGVSKPKSSTSATQVQDKQVPSALSGVYTTKEQQMSKLIGDRGVSTAFNKSDIEATRVREAKARYEQTSFFGTKGEYYKNVGEQKRFEAWENLQTDFNINPEKYPTTQTGYSSMGGVTTSYTLSQDYIDSYNTSTEKRIKEELKTEWGNMPTYRKVLSKYVTEPLVSLGQGAVDVGGGVKNIWKSMATMGYGSTFLRTTPLTEEEKAYRKKHIEKPNPIDFPIEETTGKVARFVPIGALVSLGGYGAVKSFKGFTGAGVSKSDAVFGTVVDSVKGFSPVQFKSFGVVGYSKVSGTKWQQLGEKPIVKHNIGEGMGGSQLKTIGGKNVYAGTDVYKYTVATPSVKEGIAYTDKIITLPKYSLVKVPVGRNLFETTKSGDFYITTGQGQRQVITLRTTAKIGRFDVKPEYNLLVKNQYFSGGGIGRTTDMTKIITGGKGSVLSTTFKTLPSGVKFAKVVTTKGTAYKMAGTENQIGLGFGKFNVRTMSGFRISSTGSGTTRIFNIGGAGRSSILRGVDSATFLKQYGFGDKIIRSSISRGVAFGRPNTASEFRIFSTNIKPNIKVGIGGKAGGKTGTIADIVSNRVGMFGTQVQVPSTSYSTTPVFQVTAPSSSNLIIGGGMQTGFIPIVSARPTQGLITGNIPLVSPSVITTPKAWAGTVVIQEPVVVDRVITSSKSRTTQVIIPEVIEQPEFIPPTGRGDGFRITPPPFVPPPFFLPPLSFDLEGMGGLRKIKASRKYAYTPSFGEILRVKRFKTSLMPKGKRFTGLEIRPLMFKKTKKKGRRKR